MSQRHRLDEFVKAAMQGILSNPTVNFPPGFDIADVSLHVANDVLARLDLFLRIGPMIEKVRSKGEPL